MTTATTSKKNQQSDDKNQLPPSSHSFLLWFVLLIAVAACAASGYLLWSQQKQASSLQLNQNQIKALESQSTQVQSSLQAQLQTALDQNKQTIQNELTKFALDANQANKKIALSSAAYLVRMANLALIINQDPKVATQFLDLAQMRLKNMPALESLRVNITNAKEQLIQVPDLDIDGILMQLGALKKVVMHIPVTPKMPVTDKAGVKSDATAKTEQSKVSANWKTLWSWLQRFMIITHHESDPNVLPTPEHLQSVQDSVYLGLSTAQWAVLHKNTQVYAHALNAAMTQLKSIEQNDPRMVDQLLAQLQKLSNISVDPHYPNLDDLMNQIVTLQDQATAMPTAKVQPKKTTKTTVLETKPNRPAYSENKTSSNNKKDAKNVKPTAQEVMV